MSQCKNRIGERCKLNGELCKHLVYDGKCKFAKLDEFKKVSFKEALDAILTAKLSRRKRDDYQSCYRKMLKFLGAKWSDPIDMFEYEVAESLALKLSSKYAPATIARFFGALYFAGHIKFRTYYKEIGKRCPLFERYIVKVKRHPHDPMTWEQRNAIEYRMQTLRNVALDENVCARKRGTARNQFVAMWWGKHFGTRPGDINNIKWENITYLNGIPHVKWKPHKTEDYDTEVCWPVSENAFNQIKPFRETSKVFCLDSDDKFIPKRGHKPKERRKFTYMWKSINKFFRSIGFSGMYAFYELRYASCQETYKKYGEEAERMKHGHSVRTAQMSYYNKHDHSFAI